MDYVLDMEKNVEKGKHDKFLSKRGRTRITTLTLFVNNMRKIVFLTGSRGEWRYIRPILKLIDEDPELDYAIIATNMHLLPEFGMSVDEIEKAGFRVEEKIYMTYDGYNAETMVKSLGSLLIELPGVLRRLNPDILVLAGDRGEQLMGCLTMKNNNSIF